MVFNEALLHDLNMGYYTLAGMTPHSSVGYNEAENRFFHPWSINSSGREYGYGKLKELLPLKDFMTLPNCVLEDMIEGVIEGEKERAKADKTAQEERDRRDVPPGLTKEQEALLRQAGVLPNK